MGPPPVHLTPRGCPQAGVSSPARLLAGHLVLLCGGVVPAPQMARRLKGLDLVGQLSHQPLCVPLMHKLQPRGARWGHGASPGAEDHGAHVLLASEGVKTVLELEGGMRRARGQTC